jgi:propanol-preferring alcohol dehydrogenase
MRAMQYVGESRLHAIERPPPLPAAGQVRVRVEACGVCRTDLHLVDGELPQARPPVIPGHEVVGIVEAVGVGAALAPGARVGIPWLGRSCGCCRHCREGRENLCDAPEFTGCNRDGGFATHALAQADWCLPLPQSEFPDAVAAAPLLCAGLIGWRALKLAGDGEVLGIYGFGAAAHIIAQVARWQGRRVHAFTRPGDHAAQAFARELGAGWAGGSDQAAPEELDAAIVFAPVGALVPLALRGVRKGGSVVCGGIHMSPIPSFPYELLWQERRIQSVANLTRADGHEFLELAARVPIRTHTHAYPLAQANQALDDLRHGRFSGAAVLVP